MSGIGGLDAITIDCADPMQLARFWAQVLGTEIESAVGDPTHYVDLFPLPGVPILRFQRVPEPKSVKNRVHLDISVDDLDEALAHIEQSGGRAISERTHAEYGYDWRVVADPEGNEFCLVIRRTPPPRAV
jgi:predicted enzyme related to lactoylglutathione lyase